ncbi:MAG: acyl carrier protein [Lachnospiraceae bacterium]|nr:acyl carrier protein [Lachnospiraceae bacterium]
MTVEEKMEMLEEIMDLEEGTLKKDAVLADIEEWDSMSKLSLMAEVKKRLGNKLEPGELMKFKTVQDILDYLQ